MADWEERFGEYVERLGDVLGHADRRAPLRAYTTGLLLPGERKSVEPMAARVDPARVGAAHQSLHRFAAKAAWDDAILLAAVRAYALPAMLERGPGPGLARGRHRPAEEGQALGRGGAPVLRPARQAGQLPGRGDPLGRDRGRLAAGRLPALPARGLGRRPGAAGDGGGAGRGRVRDQAGDRAGPDQAGAGRRCPARGGGDRRRLRQRHRLPRRDHRAWPALRGRHPGHDRPVAARRGAAAGRARGGRWPAAEAAAPGRAAQPLAAGRLAAGLPADAWRTVTWREGTAGPLASRFAAV